MMKRLLGLVILILLVLLLFNMSGFSHLFNDEPIADTARNEQGNLILQDTPRMWNFWTESVEFRIANEVEGKRPEGGHPSWNTFWVSLIETNKTGRENPERYIDYIIKQRQSAGLPPLEGLPE